MDRRPGKRCAKTHGPRWRLGAGLIALALVVAGCGGHSASAHRSNEGRTTSRLPGRGVPTLAQRVLARQLSSLRHGLGHLNMADEPQLDMASCASGAGHTANAVSPVLYYDDRVEYHVGDWVYPSGAAARRAAQGVAGHAEDLCRTRLVSQEARAQGYQLGTPLPSPARLVSAGNTALATAQIVIPYTQQKRDGVLHVDYVTINQGRVLTVLASVYGESVLGNDVLVARVLASYAEAEQYGHAGRATLAPEFAELTRTQSEVWRCARGVKDAPKLSSPVAIEPRGADVELLFIDRSDDYYRDCVFAPHPSEGFFLFGTLSRLVTPRPDGIDVVPAEATCVRETSGTGVIAGEIARVGTDVRGVMFKFPHATSVRATIRQGVFEVWWTHREYPDEVTLTTKRGSAVDVKVPSSAEPGTFPKC